MKAACHHQKVSKISEGNRERKQEGIHSRPVPRLKEDATTTDELVIASENEVCKWQDQHDKAGPSQANQSTGNPDQRKHKQHRSTL